MLSMDLTIKIQGVYQNGKVYKISGKFQVFNNSLKPNILCRFNLYAVSNHFGSLEGGHYTAYCSSDVLKRWYKFDDQDVSVMDAADVVTPAAYILFYTALEGQNSLPPLG